MTTKQRTFRASDILTVTTGYFLSDDPNDEFGILYNLLNYLTGDNLYTHQLGRVADECAPYLRDQFKWAAEFDDIDISPSNYLEISKMANDKYGRELSVHPIPMDDHDVIDPLTELLKMAPHAKILTLAAPADDD